MISTDMVVKTLSRRELLALAARGPNRERGWARWTLPWRSPEPGRHELLARATDREGLVQPETVPFNDNGYRFWAVARHPVRVT